MVPSETSKGVRQSKEVVCKFSRSVAGTGLEKCLVTSLVDADVRDFSEVSKLTFDFSDIEYIDMVSLQVLVAYLRTCDRFEIPAEIELPSRKYWRDQIRAWGLDCALSLATGRNLHWFASENSKKYFDIGDKQMSFDLSLLPNGFVHDDAYGPRLNGIFQQKFQNTSLRDIPRKRNFFAFHSFDALNTSDNIGVANREKQDWQKENIERFFKRHVRVDTKYLSSRIIFEALFNALRHPNAEIVQTSTFFSLGKKPKPQSEIVLSSEPAARSRSATIHFWDDGKPMLESYSLKLADREATTRLGKDPDFTSIYKVEIQDSEEDQQFLLSSDEDVSAASPDWKKLVSLTFPEVSSALEKPGHDVAEEVKIEEDSRLSAKGMGLYLMLHAATRVQDGTLTIRTGRLRAKFTKNKMKGRRKDCSQNHDFNVYLRVYPKCIPEFKGNLVIIGMPSKT